MAEPYVLSLSALNGKSVFLEPLLRETLKLISRDWTEKDIEDWYYISGVSINVEMRGAIPQRLLPPGKDDPNAFKFNTLLYTKNRKKVNFIKLRLFLIWIQFFLTCREYDQKPPITTITSMDDTPTQIFDFGKDRLREHIEAFIPFVQEYEDLIHGRPLVSLFRRASDLVLSLLEAPVVQDGEEGEGGGAFLGESTYTVFGVETPPLERRDSPVQLNRSLKNSPLSVRQRKFANSRSRSIEMPILLTREKEKEKEKANHLMATALVKGANPSLMALLSKSTKDKTIAEGVSFLSKEYLIECKRRWDFTLLDDHIICNVSSPRLHDQRILKGLKDCFDTLENQNVEIEDKTNTLNQLRKDLHPIEEGEIPSLLPRWMFVYIDNALDFLYSRIDVVRVFEECRARGQS